MTPENLPSHEAIITNQTNTIPDRTTEFTEDWVTTTYADRIGILNKIKSAISLKTYYALAEKLEQEQKECISLLNKNQEEVTHRAKYTFILDPAYFEQLFL